MDWSTHFSGHAEPELAARFCGFDPHAAVRALASLGVRATPELDYESMENRVYGVATPHGRAVVKMYRPGRWSRAALSDEVAFIGDLERAGISATRLAPWAPELNCWDGVFFLVFEHVAVPGDPLADPEVLREDQVHAGGALTARIHDVGASRPAPHRPRLDVRSVTGMVEGVRASGHLPPAAAARYDDQATTLVTHLRPLLDGLDQHRIHGDLGVNNVLWTVDGPVVMDLDDFQIGPAVADVFTATYGYQLQGHPPVPPTAQGLQAHLDAREPAQSAYLRGYRTVRPFDDTQLALREPLQLIRGLFFDAWMCGRWHDPVFRTQVRGDFPSAAWWDRALDRREPRLERLAVGAHLNPDTP